MYLKKLDRGQGGIHSSDKVQRVFFGEKQVAVPYMGRLHPEGLINGYPKYNDKV